MKPSLSFEVLPFTDQCGPKDDQLEAIMVTRETAHAVEFVNKERAKMVTLIKTKIYCTIAMSLAVRGEHIIGPHIVCKQYCCNIHTDAILIFTAISSLLGSKQAMKGHYGYCSIASLTSCLLYGYSECYHYILQGNTKTHS